MNWIQNDNQNINGVDQHTKLYSHYYFFIGQRCCFNHRLVSSSLVFCFFFRGGGKFRTEDLYKRPLPYNYENTDSLSLGWTGVTNRIYSFPHHFLFQEGSCVDRYIVGEEALR